jgi:hypothetical protein
LIRAGKDSQPLNAGIDEFISAALQTNMPLTLINLPDAEHAFDISQDADWSRSAIEMGFAFAARASGK